MQRHQLIEALELKPLPLEGGFYRETYRSADVLSAGTIPDRYSTTKAAGTAIYYLLTPDTFSALHRLPTDELFHFYLGGPVAAWCSCSPTARGGSCARPGRAGGQRVQALCAAGRLAGSFLERAARLPCWALTMAPGFDFSDYEAGDRATLYGTLPVFCGADSAVDAVSGLPLFQELTDKLGGDRFQGPHDEVGAGRAELVVGWWPTKLTAMHFIPPAFAACTPADGVLEHDAARRRTPSRAGADQEHLRVRLAALRVLRRDDRPEVACRCRSDPGSGRGCARRAGADRLLEARPRAAPPAAPRRRAAARRPARGRGAVQLLLAVADRPPPRP